MISDFKVKGFSKEALLEETIFSFKKLYSSKNIEWRKLKTSQNREKRMFKSNSMTLKDENTASTAGLIVNLSLSDV